MSQYQEAVVMNLKEYINKLTYSKSEIDEKMKDFLSEEEFCFSTTAILTSDLHVLSPNHDDYKIGIDKNNNEERLPGTTLTLTLSHPVPNVPVAFYVANKSCEKVGDPICNTYTNEDGQAFCTVQPTKTTTYIAIAKVTPFDKSEDEITTEEKIKTEEDIEIIPPLENEEEEEEEEIEDTPGEDGEDPFNFDNLYTDDEGRELNIGNIYTTGYYNTNDGLFYNKYENNTFKEVIFPSSDDMFFLDLLTNNVYEYKNTNEYNNNIYGYYNDGDKQFYQNPIDNNEVYDKIEYIKDYLYEAHYTNLDYDNAFKYFITQQNNENINACSTIRKDKWVGRNYDWTYDEIAEFIVKTPHNNDKYATLGVANVPGITDSLVNSDIDSPLYKIIPFRIVDGINEYGLTISTNVVPMDKTPTTTTTPTTEVKQTLCTSMLPRFCLDYFQTANECIEYLKKYVALYVPKGLQDLHYEPHFIIADKKDTYLIEIINNQIITINMNDDANTSLAGKPYMTNFYLSDAIINPNKTVYTPETQDDNYNAIKSNYITPNGCGLERYNIIATEYDSVLNEEHMRNLLNQLNYSNAYIDNIHPWYTEFVNINNLTVTSKPDEFNKVIKVIQKMYNNRSRDKENENYGTWHTQHSSIYNIYERTLNIIVQEDGEELKYSLDYYSNDDTQHIIIGQSNYYYIDTNTQIIYIYNEDDKTFIRPTSFNMYKLIDTIDNNQYDGYYNEENELFYYDENYTQQIPLKTNFIYNDILTGINYIYDDIEKRFLLEDNTIIEKQYKGYYNIERDLFYYDEECINQIPLDTEFVYIDRKTKVKYGYFNSLKEAGGSEDVETENGFIPMTSDIDISSEDVVIGFYDDKKFYQNEEHTIGIDGDKRLIYQDIVTDIYYSYDDIDKKFNETNYTLVGVEIEETEESLSEEDNEEEIEYLEYKKESDEDYIIINDDIEYEGYYDEENQLFYIDYDYTNTIEKNEEYIYIDKITQKNYYYDTEENMFLENENIDFTSDDYDTLPIIKNEPSYTFNEEYIIDEEDYEDIINEEIDENIDEDDEYVLEEDDF